jgi:hypothetical protein
VSRLGKEDLKALYFDLGVDDDLLPGEGRAAKAIELLRYLDDRGRLAELVEVGRKLRPDVEWPAVPEGTDPDAWEQEKPVAHTVYASAPLPLRTRIPDARAVRLVGRDEDLRWVCRRLKAQGTAAIAGVRGIGGIGKTELAIAAARELEDHFEGRVIWLDCGPNDIHALQERLAAAVGARLEGNDLRLRADVLALALRQ